MSTMTIERRRKLEDHIMYAYLFKHAGIGHGSNGWDLIYGPVGDSPCIFAKPSLTGINGGFEINWFIPNEHGNESQPYKLYITAGTNTPYSDALVAKRELTDAKDHIEEIDRCLNQANDIIDEWKSNTCCETPTEARKHIEELMQENASLQASVHNLEFTKAIGKEFGLKGCSTRRAYAIKRNTDRYFKRINALNHILYGDGSTTYGRSLEGIQKYLDRYGYSCIMDAIEHLELEKYALKEGKKRCDNVDDMLEKDKKCIEFSMHSMIATHKPYQENTEIAITGMIPGREILADIPFDIPCDVVMVSKRYFERIQAENDKLRKNFNSLKDMNDHLGDTIKKERAYVLELQKEIAAWQNATGRKTPEEAEKRIDGILDDLSKADDDIVDLGIEIKKLQDRIKAGSRNMIWITSNGLLISESDKTVEALESQVDKLNDELGDQIPHINELDARIKELSNVISQWTSETGFKDPVICRYYIDLLKREGKTKSDLISNLAKKVANDETLSKLVGFSSVEELQDYLTNEAECDTLQEAIHMMCKEMDRRQKKIDELRDDISGRSTVIKSCKREIESLKAALRASNSIMLEELEQEIDAWQKATGCKLPSMAKEKIEHYKRRLGNAVQAASCAAKHLDNITF